MKVLFVGNILPMEVVDLLKLSIAGKKYELALTKALNEILGDNLKIVSAAKRGRKESKQIANSFVFPGKKFKVLLHGRVPFLNDLITNLHFFIKLFFWSISNLRHRRVALILNSPFGFCIAAILLKYMTGIKPVSLTIDTPFVKDNDFGGIVGFYNKISFKIGHKILKLFSGIILLNKGVLDVLKLKIRHHITSIGFDEKRYQLHSNIKNHKAAKSNIGAYKVVYAGTLMHSKGISNLMEAFELIDNKNIELNLYGYGPLENAVIEHTKQNDKVKFFGRINNDELQLKFTEADLLINPILIEDSSHDFGFPSKLTEYILSGCPVLTTRFKSLPEQYLSFVFLINEETPNGIRQAILSVYNEADEVIKAKVEQGIEYIMQNQNWGIISVNLKNFLETI